MNDSDHEKVSVCPDCGRKNGYYVTDGRTSEGDRGDWYCYVCETHVSDTDERPRWGSGAVKPSTVLANAGFDDHAKEARDND